MKGSLRMKPQVGIIRLATSNSGSISRGLSALGVEVLNIDDRHKLQKCSHVIIPGVSTFGAVVEELESSELFEPIKDLFGSKTKILGLCAGMQIMGEDSEESPGSKGLGWFNFKSIRISGESGSARFHTGWNSIQTRNRTQILSATSDSTYYFNHSYYVPADGNKFGILGTTRYLNVDITSLFVKENVAGIQFHPEKSQKSGLAILKSFSDWR